MNTIDLEPYKIVHKIHAHNEPIRAMCNGPFNDIVTASQDRTVKRWIGVVNDDGSEVVVEQFGDIITHNHWVTSLISLKPEVLPAFPNGLIITGCMDSIIRLYDGLTSELLYTLVGHEKGIISFSFCDSHENVHSNTMRVSSSSSSSSTPSDKKIYLISGSWDGTAKVWDLSSCAPSSTAMSVVGDEAVSVAVPEEQLLMPIATLPGHENGVHACGIMVFGQPIVITTSTGESVNNKPANFQIRFWNCLTEEELSADYRIKDHAGPIRSIKCLKVRTNDTNTQTTCSFMTTSNDGTIKLRDVVMCWNHESNTIEILDCQCFGTVFHPSDGEFPPFILDCCTVQSASPSPTVNVGEENRLGNLPLNHFSSYITCGEDGSVLSWKGRDAVHSGTDLEQCIMHPCSVWCGVDASYFYSHVEDQRAFGTGGHDGVLRIFSTHAITTESAILQAAFSEEVSEMEKKKHKGPTDEDLKNAPKWENRGSNFGKSDQQVAVFNKDNKLIAAQWEAASQSWIEIGVVTGNSDGKSR